MKNWIKKIVIGAAVVVAAQSVAIAQQGFSLNDRDNALPQLCFRINVNTGGSTNVGNLVDNVTGANAVAEYEGLASIGSALYGVSEYDPLLPTLERANLALISPAPASSSAGGSCRRSIVGQSGDGANNVLFGTEAGAAYNTLDGFIYNFYGDDLNVGPRGEIMRLYTLSPTTGKAAFVGDVRLDSAAGAPLYLDGAAFDNSPVPLLYGSDGRGIAGQPDSLYTVDYANPQPDPANPGNFVVIATRVCQLPNTSEDTGLAFDFANSRLFILYEGRDVPPPQGRIQQITPGVGVCTFGPARNLLPFVSGDYEGFDIPTQTVR